jgi:pilus assembly protein CpaF
MTETLDTLVRSGPLGALLSDPQVRAIRIEGPRSISVVRGGRNEVTALAFEDEGHLVRTVERLVSVTTERTSTRLEGRMVDGSRLTVIFPPLAPGGTYVYLRRSNALAPLTDEDLVALELCPAALMDLLQSAVRSRLNLLVIGKHTSGRSTLLEALSRSVPHGQHVVSIEDTATLALQHRHVTRLEGRGRPRPDLVRTAVQMCPDRLVLDELEGSELLPLLDALDKGFPGSMVTMIAHDPQDALARLKRRAEEQRPGDLASHVVAIARAFPLVVHVELHLDGYRRIVSVTELVGARGLQISTQDLFVFERARYEGSRVRGTYRGRGISPRFSPQLAAHGIRLPPGLFQMEFEV